MFLARVLLAAAGWSLLLCPVVEASAFVVMDARAESPASGSQKGPATELALSALSALATAIPSSSTESTSPTVLVKTTTLIISVTPASQPSTIVTSSSSAEPLTKGEDPSPSSSAGSNALVTGSGDGSNVLSGSSALTSSAPSSSTSAVMTNGYTSGIGSSRTTVITLSTVLSIVGAFVILGVISVCWRHRQTRRFLFFRRGITPIDDDEIATWKVGSGRGEKSGGRGQAPAPVMGPGGLALAGYGATGPLTGSPPGPSHAKKASVSSYTKKPPSVIVYPHPSVAAGQGAGGGRFSEDSHTSPRHYGSYSSYGGSTKRSFEHRGGELASPAPIQARAPNARAGLTDESVPGDEPFLPSPKRHPSRLSKVQPAHHHHHSHHGRTRGSRSSSMRSFTGGSVAWADPFKNQHQDGGGYGSDLELSSSPPRVSHEYVQDHRGRHSRVFSSSSIPPRVSFGDDYVVGGLSPRPSVRDDEIGRAIG